MPSTTKKQRAALFAKKGERWVKKHGFDKLRRRKKGGRRRKH